jgi:HD superfamily phosphodiesterase
VEHIPQLDGRPDSQQDPVPPNVTHEFVPGLVECAIREPRGNTNHPGCDRVTLDVWARRTAQRLLAQQLPRRWAHTQGAAHRAEQVAQVLPSADRPHLVAAAWFHDIGYATELVDTGFHPLDGARFLAHAGVPGRVCALVAYHSGAKAVAELLGLADQLASFAEEQGPVRDALWYCDMTTSPDGRPVSFAGRIREIRSRRGMADPVVRALATNYSERAAAVRRTERLLDITPSHESEPGPAAAPGAGDNNE